MQELTECWLKTLIHEPMQMHMPEESLSNRKQRSTAEGTTTDGSTLLSSNRLREALGQQLSLPSPVKFICDQKYYYSLNRKNYTLPTTFNI